MQNARHMNSMNSIFLKDQTNFNFGSHPHHVVFVVFFSREKCQIYFILTSSLGSRQTAAGFPRNDSVENASTV